MYYFFFDIRKLYVLFIINIHYSNSSHLFDELILCSSLTLLINEQVQRVNYFELIRSVQFICFVFSQTDPVRPPGPI
jgi:hypothetical protein